MTLNKTRMVREVGRRTRLPNREVQQMLETLIVLWSESLVVGERIELENFLVLETRTIDRGEKASTLRTGQASRYVRRVVVRVSRSLKERLQV